MNTQDFEIAWVHVLYIALFMELFARTRLFLILFSFACVPSPLAGGSPARRRLPASVQHGGGRLKTRRQRRSAFPSAAFRG